MSIGCTNLDYTLESSKAKDKANSSFTVVPIEKVNWEQLNPARGDKSPQAGTLWGNRKGEEPTGFLAKFVDGFSSPPHIHNATYRAVVIEGLIHNDDPSAEKMWMPLGSFWTQPKGEVHITAAKGDSNMALVEIDMGPYLVLHEKDKFDSGERPVNLDPSNIVWLAPDGFKISDTAPKIAYLWGDISDANPNGTFLSLPKGFNGEIWVNSPTFRAVVIKGQVKHKSYTYDDLMPGSYFCSTGGFTHAIATKSESILYIRAVGKLSLIHI